LLKKNIEKIQRLGPKTSSLFNFLPMTFVLPKEYCQFMEEFYKGMALEGPENIWIMKPIGKSRGRGISLVNEISKVVYAEQVGKIF
jgi:tubulin polyglutamylase TTLL5